MSTMHQQQTLPPWSTILQSVQACASLPTWLANAAHAKHVRDILATYLPAFQSGSHTLQSCQVKFLRLSHDHIGWTGNYHCVVAGQPPTESAQLTLRGNVLPPSQPVPEHLSTDIPFGKDGWSWYCPPLHVVFTVQPPEMKLAALAELTDPETACTLLEQCLVHTIHVPHDRLIATCHPQVLRYHPGLRCTIGYQLTFTSPAVAAWPSFVVAKTYEDDTGANTYTNMTALWNASLRTRGVVIIAEPLAYLPERRMLLQGPIPEEQTLQTFMAKTLQHDRPEAMTTLTTYLETTAVALAEVHTTGVVYAQAHHWSDELAGVRTFSHRLTRAVPALEEPIAAIFACLETLATASVADSFVPCHGTFRPAQVLLDHGRIGFIDFDSSCQAEPAMDLALFMVAIVDSGMRAFMKAQDGSKPLSSTASTDRLIQLENIAARFLDVYAAHRPVSRQRVALWQALNILEVVLRSWERVKPVRLEYTVRMLERALHTQYT